MTEPKTITTLVVDRMKAYTEEQRHKTRSLMVLAERLDRRAAERTSSKRCPVCGKTTSPGMYTQFLVCFNPGCREFQQ